MTEIRCEIFDGEAEIVSFTSDGGRELVFRIEGGADGFVSMDGVAARASHEEKRAVLLLCREWDEAEIRAAVASCGFTASAMQTKRITPAES